MTAFVLALFPDSVTGLALRMITLVGTFPLQLFTGWAFAGTYLYRLITDGAFL